MTLATRCAACGTVFRVVQDQLKVSEGWVRCGRCKEVFNALEAVFDLEHEAPPPWQPPRHPAMPLEDHGAAAYPALNTGDEAAYGSYASAPASIDIEIEPAPRMPATARVSARSSRYDLAEATESSRGIDSRFDDEPDAIEPAWARSELPAAVDEGLPPGESSEAASDEAPAFMRPAQAPDRPRLQAALGIAAGVLAVILLAQLARHSRDSIVASWPATRPLLALLCSPPSCRIDAPRRIEDIAVESSTLTAAGPASTAGTSSGAAQDASGDASSPSDAMRLAVVLRNRAGVALLTPTIDLSLTDSSGALVARRALSAGDFHSASTTLAPSTETTLQLLLATPGRKVSGYTVEIFYP